MQLQHLLGIEPLHPQQIIEILDLADQYVALNRGPLKHSDVLAGLTQINMFFENSTRTQASFELAGKRLGADVMNMAMQASSIKKGETLIDTALTFNAMHPDIVGGAPPALWRSRICWHKRSIARYSMPATAGTSTRRRPFWTGSDHPPLPKAGCTA